jgi:hypothetical protein
VGGAYINQTPTATTGIPTIDPFLWEHGRMIDLGALGGTIGNPVGLNNRGEVVGTLNLADGAGDVVEVQEPSARQFGPVGKTGRLETTTEAAFRSGNLSLWAGVFRERKGCRFVVSADRRTLKTLKL